MKKKMNRAIPNWASNSRVVVSKPCAIGPNPLVDWADATSVAMAVATEDGSPAEVAAMSAIYAGSSVASLVTEKKTVAMTSAINSTTTRMVSTSASQPGSPRPVRRPGIGSTVMVITTANRIGLRIGAAARIPNSRMQMAARLTR